MDLAQVIIEYKGLSGEKFRIVERHRYTGNVIIREKSAGEGTWKKDKVMGKAIEEKEDED